MVEPEGGPRAVFRRPLTTLKTSDGIIRVLIHFTITQCQKVNNEKGQNNRFLQQLMSSILDIRRINSPKIEKLVFLLHMNI